MKIIVRRTAGIGDSLAATVVADLLHDQGHEVVWQCHPEIIPIIKRHPTIVRVEPPRGHCDVNLDGAYENHWKQLIHFHDAFIMEACKQLVRIGISINVNRPQKPPKLVWKTNDEQAFRAWFDEYPSPRISICPRSLFQTRCVPDSVWSEAIPLMQGTKFWLGQHPPPPVEYLMDRRNKSIESVSSFIACSDLVVTVDTGPMHIASAYGIPMVVISQSHDVHLRLSPLSDFEVVQRRDLDCLNCQRHRCPIDPYNPPCGQIDPKELADVVNRKLAKLEPSNPIAA